MGSRSGNRLGLAKRIFRISFGNLCGSYLVKFLGSRLENFGGYSFGNFLGVFAYGCEREGGGLGVRVRAGFCTRR